MKVRKLFSKSFCIFLSPSPQPRCQTDQQVDIIRLHRRFVCCAVTADLTAPITLVNDDIPLARVGLYTNGAQNAAAIVLPVAGIHVYVQRAQAPRAMVA